MRIIKEPPTFKPLQLTCPHCTAQLEADKPTDFVRIQGYDQRDNDSWDYAVTVCPCCHGQIRVESNQFPKHVYEVLKRKEY